MQWPFEVQKGLIERNAGVPEDRRIDRAADGVDDAAELDIASIAGAFHDTAVTSGNSRVDEVAAQTPKTRERTILVGAP